MANYTVSSYDLGGLSLTQNQLLAWSSATVSSIGTSSIVLRVRDGGDLGLPGDYDIRLSGSFTLQGGVLTGGTITSIAGRLAGTATTVSSIFGVSLNIIGFLIPSNPPTFSNPSFSSLFGGADTLSGGAGDDTLSGSGGVDTIIGNTGNDTIRGGLGADNLNGGTGNDTFVYLGGEIAAGETIEGGIGSDTINVFSTADFSSAFVANVETLRFAKPVGAVTVTLNSTQVGLGTLGKVQFIEGSDATDNLILNAINGLSIDTDDLVYANWSANDTITINGTQFVQNDLRGTAQKETINGSDQEDIFRSGGGADILNGGASDDVFRFNDASQVDAGLQINGGTQTDKIALDDGTGFDFSLIALNSVEQVQFFQSFQTASFLASQVGVGKINEFNALNGVRNIVSITNASILDLSTTFMSGFDSTDRIMIAGTAGVDIIIGSSANDTIIGAAGADILSGGLGNDVFQYNTSGAVGVETIDGGSGTDTLIVTSTAVNFNTFFSTSFLDATISSVEVLSFDGPQPATLNIKLRADQIGGAAQGRISTVVAASPATIGFNSNDSLIVEGSGIDLSAVTFVDWAVFGDFISLVGTGPINTILGSNQADDIRLAAGSLGFVTAGQGDDEFFATNSEGASFFNGGAGFDRINIQGLFSNSNVVNCDISSMTITETEELFGRTNIVGESLRVVTSGNHYTATNFTRVNADFRPMELVVNGSSVNLSSVLFLGFGQSSVTINGTNGADNLIGSSQNDRLTGGTNVDTTNGGLGNDFHVVDNINDVVIEVAGQGLEDRVATSVSYRLSTNADIEVFTTNNSSGTSNLNLTGNALSQSIVGNNGNNRINGMAGSDTLRGNLGSDTFMFKSALGATNIDRLVDFAATVDKIELDQSIFNTIIQAAGTLLEDLFQANATGDATQADDRILYDNNGGQLYFDADGNGAIAKIQFAQLFAGTALTFTDFTIVP